MTRRLSRAFAAATLLCALCALCASALAVGPPTMRLDYYHTGRADREEFSVERVAQEPLPWPGGFAGRIDDTNLGKYFFELRDEKSGRVLFSRGFASIYGEWETTDEARNTTRTFQESLRFPTPDAPVRIVLKKRDKQNVFQEIWTTRVDPKDIFVERAI